MFASLYNAHVPVGVKKEKGDAHNNATSSTTNSTLPPSVYTSASYSVDLSLNEPLQVSSPPILVSESNKRKKDQIDTADTLLQLTAATSKRSKHTHVGDSSHGKDEVVNMDTTDLTVSDTKEEHLTATFVSSGPIMPALFASNILPSRASGITTQTDYIPDVIENEMVTFSDMNGIHNWFSLNSQVHYARLDPSSTTDAMLRDVGGVPKEYDIVHSLRRYIQPVVPQESRRFRPNALYRANNTNLLDELSVDNIVDVDQMDSIMDTTSSNATSVQKKKKPAAKTTSSPVVPSTVGTDSTQRTIHLFDSTTTLPGPFTVDALNVPPYKLYQMSIDLVAKSVKSYESNPQPGNAHLRWIHNDRDADIVRFWTNNISGFVRTNTTTPNYYFNCILHQQLDPLSDCGLFGRYHNPLAPVLALECMLTSNENKMHTLSYYITSVLLQKWMCVNGTFLHYMPTSTQGYKESRAIELFMFYVHHDLQSPVKPASECKVDLASPLTLENIDELMQHMSILGMLEKVIDHIECVTRMIGMNLDIQELRRHTSIAVGKNVLTMLSAAKFAEHPVKNIIEIANETHRTYGSNSTETLNLKWTEQKNYVMNTAGKMRAIAVNSLGEHTYARRLPRFFSHPHFSAYSALYKLKKETIDYVSPLKSWCMHGTDQSKKVYTVSRGLQIRIINTWFGRNIAEWEEEFVPNYQDPSTRKTFDNNIEALFHRQCDLAWQLCKIQKGTQIPHIASALKSDLERVCSALPKSRRCLLSYTGKIKLDFRSLPNMHYQPEMSPIRARHSYYYAVDAATPATGCPVQVYMPSIMSTVKPLFPENSVMYMNPNCWQWLCTTGTVRFCDEEKKVCTKNMGDLHYGSPLPHQTKKCFNLVDSVCCYGESFVKLATPINRSMLKRWIESALKSPNMYSTYRVLCMLFPSEADVVATICNIYKTENSTVKSILERLKVDYLSWYEHTREQYRQLAYHFPAIDGALYALKMDWIPYSAPPSMQQTIQCLLPSNCIPCELKYAIRCIIISRDTESVSVKVLEEQLYRQVCAFSCDNLNSADWSGLAVVVDMSNVIHQDAYTARYPWTATCPINPIKVLHSMTKAYQHTSDSYTLTPVQYATVGMAFVFAVFLWPIHQLWPILFPDPKANIAVLKNLDLSKHETVDHMAQEVSNLSGMIARTIDSKSFRTCLEYLSRMSREGKDTIVKSALSTRGETCLEAILHMIKNDNKVRDKKQLQEQIYSIFDPSAFDSVPNSNKTEIKTQSMDTTSSDSGPKSIAMRRNLVTELNHARTALQETCKRVFMKSLRDDKDINPQIWISQLEDLDKRLPDDEKSSNVVASILLRIYQDESNCRMGLQNFCARTYVHTSNSDLLGSERDREVITVLTKHDPAILREELVKKHELLYQIRYNTSKVVIPQTMSADPSVLRAQALKIGQASNLFASKPNKHNGYVLGGK